MITVTRISDLTGNVRSRQIAIDPVKWEMWESGTVYDVNYFINKFEKIPSKKIIPGEQSDGKGGHCVYGWCMKPEDLGPYTDKGYGHKTKEGLALTELLSSIPNMTPSRDNLGYSFTRCSPYSSTPARINNGEVAEYQQATPKERILAALQDVKSLQHKKS